MLLLLPCSIALPFLDVLEGLLDEEEEVDDFDPDSEEQSGDNSEGDDDDSDELLQQCLSETDLPVSEDDEKEKEDEEGEEDEDEDATDQEMDENPLYGDGYYYWIERGDTAMCGSKTISIPPLTMVFFYLNPPLPCNFQFS